MTIQYQANCGGPARGKLAFTLPELIVTLTLFGLTVVGLLSSHVMGLRMYNITATKLSASAGARTALNNLRADIRGGKLLFVGNGNASTFYRIPSGQPQVGNAVQIYPTVDTNLFIRYYLDVGKQELHRLVSSNSTAEVMARYVTNGVTFRAENHLGTVLTNEQNHRVVRMLLEFYQWEFPVAKVGGHYDYYRLQTRITRRAIE